MKGVKKTLAMSLASTIFLTPSFANNLLETNVQEDRLESKVEYEIQCSVFKVGESYYSSSEDDKDYKIRMKMWPTGFFKFLGLNYNFVTEGHKEEGKLYPRHFNRINVDKQAKKLEVTDIYYDYEKLEAKTYAYREIDGKRETKWDTRNDPEKITKDVKDFLTILEDLRRIGLEENYEVKIIAKGRVHPFQIKKIGEETLKLNDEYYETIVYETGVHKNLFGIDSRVKVWVHKEEDHSILKVWIENGPLWTHIDMKYSGTKAELR